MEIKKLYRDVSELCEYKILYLDPCIYVNDKQEGAILKSGQDGVEIIAILKGLDKENKIETEAHELCHLLLKYSGLIGVNPYKFEFYEYDLALWINNAISHFELVKILKERYYISSSYFLATYERVVNEIDKRLKELAENNSSDYVWGVQIYDIARNLPSRREEIQIAIKDYPVINKAFELSQEYLSEIKSDMTKDKQEDLLECFLKKLRG